jgi:hypothetical protein
VLIRLSGAVVKRKKEAVEEVLWHLTRSLERRSEVCLREGVQPAHCWLGPNRQCAPVTGSGSVFRKERLQSPVAADPRRDPGVQQVTCQEDRAFSRDLLNQKGAAATARL